LENDGQLLRVEIFIDVIEHHQNERRPFDCLERAIRHRPWLMVLPWRAGDPLAADGCHIEYRAPRAGRRP
jgi:hypothetical protein